MGRARLLTGGLRYRNRARVRRHSLQLCGEVRAVCLPAMGHACCLAVPLVSLPSPRRRFLRRRDNDWTMVTMAWQMTRQWLVAAEDDDAGTTSSRSRNRTYIHFITGSGP